MTTSDHYLSSYIDETLPKLGLDVETYGPYVLGLFPLDEDDCDNYNDNDDDDEIKEQLNEVVELLRSSADSDGDDNELWDDFTGEILRRRDEFIMNLKQKQAEDRLETKRIVEEKFKASIREAEAEEDHHKKNTNITEEEKKRMEAYLEQYGDDDEEGREHHHRKNKKGGEEEELMEPNRNRQYAAEAEKRQRDRMKAETSKSASSKKAAREATAKQRLDKMAKKDERRKRTTKSERKR